MNVAKYKDILKIYERIDLYRAKYRHNDFTPHAWCFHGNQAQGWIGTCQNGYLKVNGKIEYNRVFSINAATYKYITLRFVILGISPKYKRLKLTLNYQTQSGTFKKETIVPYDNQAVTALIDMSGEGSWSGTVNDIIISFSIETTENVWTSITSEVRCEYIKVDKENVFVGIIQPATITTEDVNTFRSKIETFAKQQIDWYGPDEVRHFIDTIKKKDIDEANERITTLKPYNGCATCDNYQCGCDMASYGYVPCQRCNACNQYRGCSSCDYTCYEETRTCGCNSRCYSYSSCSCDWKCYLQEPCRCDGRCYSYSTKCSQCHTTRHKADIHCPCYVSCYGYSCELEYGDTIPTDCNYCDSWSDAGCAQSDKGSGCKCNSKCYSEGKYDGDWTCKQTCDKETCICNSGDSSRAELICTICDRTCYAQQEDSVCTSGYGEVTCTCDYRCYGQSSCSCDSGCYLQPRSCTCDRRCYGYQGCQVCDVCDLYKACTCNATCHQQSCEQCHKTSYSSVIETLQ